MNYKEILEEYLTKTRKTLKRVNNNFETIEEMLNRSDFMTFYNESFKFQAQSEQLVKLARGIPVMTGIPHALEEVQDVILEESGVGIQVDNKGWVKIDVPSLLPKKESGDASYIRATVETAMRNYFDQSLQEKISEPSVIIFRHLYDHRRPEREYRDHDNIEVNVIVDLVALYLLVDDHPMKLKHYYTSAKADDNKTEVFLIPIKDFGRWLEEYETSEV